MAAASMFGFEGRMRRSRWWLTQIALLLGPGVVFVGAVYATSALERTVALQAIVGVAATVALGVIVWVNLAASVRRLHDQNMSGWFYLLNLIPFIGQFVTLALLGFRDSTRGANRFGPSLKYPGPAVADTFD